VQKHNRIPETHQQHSPQHNTTTTNNNKEHKTRQQNITQKREERLKEQRTNVSTIPCSFIGANCGNTSNDKELVKQMSTARRFF